MAWGLQTAMAEEEIRGLEEDFPRGWRPLSVAIPP